MLHTVKAFKITWTNKFGDHSFYEFTKKTAENSMERLRYWNPRMEETMAEVYLTPAIKREFQKLIKSIRESDFNSKAGCEYPKAIMTEGLMERGEATIIFRWAGSDANSEIREITKKKAERMMEIQSFRDFLEKEQATAKIELRDDNCYQIRIQF